MTGDDRIQQIALVSQRNAENRHKSTIFIKPCNFCIPFSLHSDRTAILVWENSKNIRLWAIFPRAGLLAWTRPDRHKQTACCWRVAGGLNWPMRVQNACSLHGRVHVKSPAHGKIADSWTFLEIFSDQNCRSITVKAEWDAEITWLYEYGVFMAILCVALWYESNLLDSVVSMAAFLRFKWRNNTEPKTRLKRPRIAHRLQTRHKDNPMLR